MESELGAPEEYSEEGCPAQQHPALVGQMESSSFPRKNTELTNGSDNTRIACYFAAGDTLRSATPYSEKYHDAI